MSSNASTGGDEGLENAILEYIEADQAGKQLDNEAFLRAHPEFRRELERFIAGRKQVERLAVPLRSVVDASTDLHIPKRGASSPGRVRLEQAREPQAAVAGQLGEYRLIREVGRGGMGVVYEAEQMSLRRRVALKVLPFAAAIDERRLQRFKNEAMAAAHLRHENIVPVYAVGADMGVHYFAMQFIEGQSLASLIDELRKAMGIERSTSGQPTADRASEETPRTGVSASIGLENASSAEAAMLSRDLFAGSRRYFDWVARLGRQAAEALHYAHQMGIVHRDIKPANLMLDPRGQVWITDFGLAQVNGDPSLTMTGEMLGTLRYASPEQALARSGVVDHRTDVYSLGATLYELLTLQPIFGGRDRAELLRQIADADPQAPRSIRPSVPEELETIVLKALAKEPSERYATAQEMAADLKRFVDNLPILARRPTVGERLRKWSRRHPAVLMTGAGVLLLLLAVSLATALTIQGERKKAEQAYERERDRANEAEAQFRLARRSVDDLFRLSEEELANNPNTEGLRRRLLTSVLSYYQEFVELRRAADRADEGLVDASRRVEQILADLAVLRAVSRLNLLSQPTVLDELGLDVGRRAKVGELSARADRQWQESLRELGRVSAAERGVRALEHARVNEGDLKALLSPDQLLRLHQIGLQIDVAAAFKEPEVAQALALTDEQRDRYRTIKDEGLREMLTAKHPDLIARDAASPTPSAKTLNERLLEILTEAQWRKWREIVGPPLRHAIRVPSPFDPKGGKPVAIPPKT